MFFKQFAGGIGAFRFYPNAEFQSQTLGLGGERGDASRQFCLVHHPVAQCGGVVVARILFSEPSVVHDKQFSAHFLDVLHHLEHSLFIDVEVNAFPRVEQNVACLVSLM